MIITHIVFISSEFCLIQLLFCDGISASRWIECHGEIVGAKWLVNVRCKATRSNKKCEIGRLNEKTKRKNKRYRNTGTQNARVKIMRQKKWLRNCKTMYISRRYREKSNYIVRIYRICLFRKWGKNNVQWLQGALCVQLTNRKKFSKINCYPKVLHARLCVYKSVRALQI